MSADDPLEVQQVLDALHIKHLKPKGTRTMLCVGPSMKPKMGYVTSCFGVVNPSFVCVSDVVGFYRKGRLFDKKIMHRVIDIDAEGNIYIKGDNAPEVDCVPLSRVFFRVLSFKKLI